MGIAATADLHFTAITERSSTRQVLNVLDVVGPHDSFVEHSDVYEHLVERHILLGVGPDQVVKLHSGDCQHRLAVEFGVVQTIQEM